MSLRVLLTSLLTFALSFSASAQIQITEADVRSFFDARVVENYIATSEEGFESLVDQTGPGQTYDFTIASYDLEESYSVETISCSPAIAGCEDEILGAANLVMRMRQADSTFVMFQTIDERGLVILGSAFRVETPEEEREYLPELGLDPSIDSLTYAMRFEPGILELLLPLTMGSSWESTSETRMMLVEADFDVSDDMEMTMSRASIVDGWGQLITPHGSAPALRYRTQNVSTVRFMGFEFADTTHTISFITAGGMMAEIFIDEVGEINEVSYTNVASSVSNESPVELPTAVQLHQNYPNPFNPSTTIAFDAMEGGHARLAIYDILGREVGVLLNRAVEPGRHEIIWDAADHPSGTYIVRIETASGTASRTMMLLK